MSTSPPTESTTCPDCGHASVGRFCATCGQLKDVNPRSFWYWVRTSIEEVASVDGRLWRTLRALVAKPGLLTTEWHKGHRTRWSHPFRLYLLASVIFFSVAILAPEPLTTSQVAGPGMAAQQALIDSRRAFTFQALPRIVILLVPLFALFLKYAFDRKRFYTEHLVYAFHLHTFGFLVLSSFYGMILLPVVLAIPLLLAGIGWLLGYAIWAGRRVYRVGWVRSTVASLAVVLLQGVVLVTAAQAAARVWADDPQKAVASAEATYWELRESEAYAGFLVIEYQRLPGYLLTPIVRAHAADLLLQLDRPDEARLEAEMALLADPDHLLALSIAARASDARNLTALAGEYRRRYLMAYEYRIRDEEFARHRADLESFRETAKATLGPS